jgi:hypothetical protein
LKKVKRRIFTVLLFLLLCAIIPAANAACQPSKFFIKVYIPPESFIGTIHTCGQTVVIQGTQSGFVTDSSVNQVGTIQTDMLLVIKLGSNGYYDSTGKTVICFKITFNDGKSLSGIAEASLVHPTIGTNQFVKGSFLAYGDKTAVIGTIENIEVGSGFALKGYSR